MFDRPRYSVSLNGQDHHTDDLNDIMAFIFDWQNLPGPWPSNLPATAALKEEFTRNLRQSETVTARYELAEGPVAILIKDELFEYAASVRDAARELYGHDSKLDIDEDQPVNMLEHGWEVECWVWVSARSAGCEDLDEDADEDNTELAYIAAAEHRYAEFDDRSRASLGDDPGAYVSGFLVVSDDYVQKHTRKQNGKTPNTEEAHGHAAD